jgi:hypothetical protein
MYQQLEAYPVTVSGTVQVSKLLPIVIMHMTTFVAADYFKPNDCVSILRAQRLDGLFSYIRPNLVITTSVYAAPRL